MEKYLPPLTKVLVSYIRPDNRKLYILEENALSWELILKDSSPRNLKRFKVIFVILFPPILSAL